MRQMQGGGVDIRSYSIATVIQNAFEIRPYQLLGAPEWVKTEPYDIQARTDGEGKVTSNQRQAMMQALLADRFQLKVHEEARETAVYEMVVKKGGPKLKQSVGNEPFSFRSVRGHYTVSNHPLKALAANLSNWTGRPVIDKTGLSGNFNIELTWEVDEASPGTSQGPAIAAAIQDQLGLKLEPAKRPMKVLVIDRIERPSEN